MAAGKEKDFESVAPGWRAAENVAGAAVGTTPKILSVTFSFASDTFFTDASCVTVCPFVTVSGDREAVTERPLALTVPDVASAVETVATVTATATRAAVSSRAGK